MSMDQSIEPLTPSQAAKLLDTIAYARIEIIHLGEVLHAARETCGEVGHVLNDTNVALRDIEDAINRWLGPPRTASRQPTYRLAAELRHVQQRLRRHLRDSFRPRARRESEDKDEER